MQITLSALRRVFAAILTVRFGRTARMKARKERSAGDHARDRAAWGDAATHYLAYLSVYPGKADIWVQLGNMYEQQKSLAKAEAAYQRAIALDLRHTDAHFQLGHLRELQLRLSDAARCYFQAYRHGRDPKAGQQLRRSAIFESLEEAGKEFLRAEAARTLSEINRHCTSSHAVAMEGIDLNSDGELIAIASEAWIEFRCQGLEGVPMALVQVEFASDLDARAFAQSELQLTYADQRNHWRRLSAASETSDHVSWVLAGPGLIAELRLNLRTPPGSRVNFRIAASPLPDFDSLSAWLKPRALAPTSNRRSIIPANTIDAIRMQQNLPSQFDVSHDYQYWTHLYPSPVASPAKRAMSAATGQKIPSFSFILPVCDPPPDLLIECLDSLIGQDYANFELCIADDASKRDDVLQILRRYFADPRVKLIFREKRGHISAASNSALALATGDYVVLVDHDDAIPRDALSIVARHVVDNPDAKILYSDEDKITSDGTVFDPYFKGIYDPFLMYGHNMVSHLGIYDRGLVEIIGGFREGLEGSQDYDLFLRCYERIDRSQVHHIPHILYHWRAIPGSTAVSADQKSYALSAARDAINGYFERNAIPLRSVNGFAPGCTAIKSSRSRTGTASIIIHCADADSSIAEGAAERLMVPGSIDVRTARASSEAVNIAAWATKSDIVCIVDARIQAVSEAWPDRARMLLDLPETGAVGGRHWTPDSKLYEFGLVLGMGKDGIFGRPHSGISRELPGYFGKARMIQEVSAVSGLCLCVRRSLFDEMRGLDEQLPLEYAAVDFCLRLSERGKRIICDPEVEFRFRAGQVPSDPAEHSNAIALMRAKWSHKLGTDPYYSPNLALDRPDFALAYPPRTAS